jgi:Flp pilus assembly protein TadG
MSRRLPATPRRERAAAAVEFALVLPILLLLLGGIIDYGRFFFTQLQLTNAAREGARAGIAGSSPLQITTRMTTAGGVTPGWQTPTTAGNCDSTAGPVTINFTANTSASFRFFFAGILPGVPQTTTVTSSATMGCV